LRLLIEAVWVILSATQFFPRRRVGLGPGGIQMAVTDDQLIGWLVHPDPLVRSASLELLTSSYVSHPGILPAIFSAWDRWGAEEAFPEFPLVSHLPIRSEMLPECLARAESMSQGRKLTDRVCRCAGKLIEALSVCDATVFESHLEAMQRLKTTSKIFFRVPIESMQERVAALHRSTSSLCLDFEDGQPSDIAIALEALLQRGQADPWMQRGFDAWADDSEPSPLARAVLELASRHSVQGFEEPLLVLSQSDLSSIADMASIALIRGRSPRTLTWIADRFAQMGRASQLRSIDIIRRTRLDRSSNLLHYLLPLGREFIVQDAIRIAEVLLFDFHAIEEWLEAFLLADDTSLKRTVYALPIAYPLALEKAPSEWPRIRHLIQSRVGSQIELPHPTP
jgi:hypothetical protein